MSIESRSNQYGKIFDHWQIRECLGSGSGGKTAVFRLKRTDGFSGECALKVINLIEEQCRFEDMSEQQLKEYEIARIECGRSAAREVELMNVLQSETHIVDYKDHCLVDWEDDNGFGRDMLIRMELLQDLRSRIRESDFFQEEEILRLGRDICKALVLCHGKNILHRDIKPENIFINANGNYKLGDFGISRIIGAAPMSKASTNVGTPEYAAPEQFQKGYDKRADIYSLGLVLYELSNRNCLPFAGSSYVRPEDIQKRQLGTALPAPRNASPALCKVILKACAFRPEERYQTAEEFLSALNQVDKGGFRFTTVMGPSGTSAGLRETVADGRGLDGAAVVNAGGNATVYANGTGNGNSTVYAVGKGGNFNAENNSVGVSSGTESEENRMRAEEKKHMLPWLIAIAAVLIALFALLPNVFTGKESDAENPTEAATAAAEETDPIVTEAPDPCAAGHDWNNATEASPKTCQRCGATEGRSLGTPLVNCIYVEDSNLQENKNDVDAGEWIDCLGVAHPNSLRFWVSDAPGWHNTEYIIYDLQKKYNTLEISVQLERHSEASASAYVNIYVDGVLTQTTPVVKRDSLAATVTADVSGATWVRIECVTDDPKFAYCIVDAAVYVGA